MPERVRVDADALHALDRQIPDASLRTLFLTVDLLPALDALAEDWEGLPRPIPGRDDYRVVILPGRSVYAFHFDAQLDPDGVITVTDIGVDLYGPRGWPQEDRDE